MHRLVKVVDVHVRVRAAVGGAERGGGCVVAHVAREATRLECGEDASAFTFLLPGADSAAKRAGGVRGGRLCLMKRHRAVRIARS